jgi:hypothetical protein
MRDPHVRRLASAYGIDAGRALLPAYRLWLATY